MNNKSINMTTTFATKCYEKDWEILIKQGGIKNKINNLNYNFDKRVLLINKNAARTPSIDTCFVNSKLSSWSNWFYRRTARLY